MERLNRFGESGAGGVTNSEVIEAIEQTNAAMISHLRPAVVARSYDWADFILVLGIACAVFGMGWTTQQIVHDCREEYQAAIAQEVEKINYPKCGEDEFIVGVSDGNRMSYLCTGISAPRDNASIVCNSEVGGGGACTITGDPDGK